MRRPDGRGTEKRLERRPQRERAPGRRGPNRPTGPQQISFLTARVGLDAGGNGAEGKNRFRKLLQTGVYFRFRCFGAYPYPLHVGDSSACDAVKSDGRAMRMEIFMKIGTKEFIEMMATFERVSKGRYRLDREKKDLWRIRVFYQDPEANKAFMAFHEGVEYGKCISRL